MKKTLLLMSMMLAAAAGYSQTYVVVGNESRLFHRPNVKSYATTNTSGADVVVSPGMVFKLAGEPQGGWCKIEYTPGLNAFMLESQTASGATLAAPRGGTYSVANNAGENVTVSGGEGSWTIKAGSETLKGVEADNAVVFSDRFGNPAYSLVVMSGKPVVYNYSNDITKFF